MADPELKDGENHNYKKATTRFNIILVRMEASQAQLLSCCDQRSGGKDERDAVSPSWPNALSAVSVPINPWPRIPLSRGRYTGKPSVEPFDERRSVGKKARCSWHQHLLLGSHAQGWRVGLFTCPARFFDQWYHGIRVADRDLSWLPIILAWKIFTCRRSRPFW